MSDDPRKGPGRDPLQEVYDELARDFERAAREEPRSRLRAFLRRRLALPLALLVLGGGAAGLAIAESGDLPVLLEATEEPLFEAECPPEVRASVFELDRLADYADTPGYPRPGCPTLEELEQSEEFLSLFERRDEISSAAAWDS